MEYLMEAGVRPGSEYFTKEGSGPSSPPSIVKVLKSISALFTRCFALLFAVPISSLL